ncbi:Lipase 2 [Madurella mycetomatis]|uniref:Lipase 2 n=1 Tax=Madurella mycetomatis TaxID=100816 RepID=A0A175WFQ1_9PEZI|nr:Lipase 2 [Madurella mycetomatis]
MRNLGKVLFFLSSALLPIRPCLASDDARGPTSNDFLSALHEEVQPTAINWPYPEYLPPPSMDPWYIPPSGWELSSPGTPLRIRPYAYPTINIKNCRDTFQILYRSSDTHGNPSWSVTTVFVPASHPEPSDANGDGPRPKLRFVSYQVPTDSVSPNAAPSYLLQAREPYGEMRDLLARGWFVATPDFEGPTASFAAGKQAAHATLDGIRAIRQAAASPLLTSFNLRPPAAAAGATAEGEGEGEGGGQDEDGMRFAIWGYSGGAFATAFALEMLPTYAPDLLPSSPPPSPIADDDKPIRATIVGGAVGGPAPNLTTVFYAMNKRDTAGLAIASLVGVTMQWPLARQFLLSRLKRDGPYNATGFLAVERMTGVESLIVYAKHDVFEYFLDGEKDVFDPIVQAVIDADSVLGVYGPLSAEVPMFVYHAIQDEISAIEETDDLVKEYCDKGGRVLYHRNELGTHNDELWSGRLRTMDFLAHVLEDKRSDNMTVPGVGECRSENVKVPLDVLELLPDWWWTQGAAAPK